MRSDQERKIVNDFLDVLDKKTSRGIYFRLIVSMFEGRKSYTYHLYSPINGVIGSESGLTRDEMVNAILDGLENKSDVFDVPDENTGDEL